METIQRNRKKVSKKRKGGRSRRNQRNAILVLALFTLIVVGIIGWIVVSNSAYKVCRVEAGVAVGPSDFLKNADANAVFTKDSQPFDVTVPGEYKVKVKSGLFTHSCTLIVEDTVAPVGTAVAVNIEVGQTCEATDFVTDITDMTQVVVSYVAEPDFSKIGKQNVSIMLTDLDGNQTILESSLSVSKAVAKLVIEAGSSVPPVENFVAAGVDAENVAFVTPRDSVDCTIVGEHLIDIEIDGETFTSILHIVDTVAPVVEVQDLVSYAQVPRDAGDFVSAVEDVTEVTVSFVKEPDITYVGTQDVEIIVTDSGNNQVTKQAKLTLEEDTEAPAINGAKDIVVYLGDSVSYKKNVKVTDNSGAEIDLLVDAAGVNLNSVGEYQVTYSAVDYSGNETNITVALTVKERMYDIEEVNALADAVLAKIITPEMTELEKVKAIYDYNMRNIGYINHSEKGDWVRAAYEGLAEGKGDCYVYACTAKILLTRAGITNMDIVKIPAKTEHYWNLVDIGDGWYHFDTTPRKDHPTIFMWTDEQMMDYSAKHNNSHNYDHEAYPTVN